MSRYSFPIPDLTGKVLTVRGPVDPASLGVTLMHEHLFVDLRRPERFWRPGEGTAESLQPLTIDNLAAVRHGLPSAANDQLDEYDVMVDEVGAFLASGGGAIVDVTPIGVGRNPDALLRLAEETDMAIVMGGGFYTPTFHPEDMSSRTVDDLTDQLVRDIVLGADGTGVRSGIIGEVGTDSNPLTPAELASVRASGRASRITGAPVTFHVGGVGEERLLVLDILAEEGVPPRNIVIGHGGEVLGSADYARRIFARGVFVELDFLSPTGSPWGHLFLGSDHKTVRGMAELIDAGYADQLLLGHDVCQKIQLKRYGGHGFDYISRVFLPALQRLGVTDEVVRAIMVDNPARALAFTAPGEPGSDRRG